LWVRVPPPLPPIFGRGLFMDKFIEYFRNAKIEIQKVIFPTSREIKQSFISVFAVVTVVSLFLSLIDVIMSAILKSVL
jgi:preprotein translocase subunit SecE